MSWNDILKEGVLKIVSILPFIIGVLIAYDPSRFFSLFEDIVHWIIRKEKK